MPPGGLLRTDIAWGVASFYDGWTVDLAITPTWIVSRFLELSGEYEVHMVRFPDREQGFEAHIARLRLQGALNTKVSTQAFVQYNSAADAVVVNARFRYNFRQGNDLWIVYDEGLNLDRHRQIPTLPASSARALLVKYTHTLTL
jgi:hypothetical protein